MDKARKDKDAPELERQMRLASAAVDAPRSTARPRRGSGTSRTPRRRSSRRATCRARSKLVAEGKTAIERGDTDELRRVVKALWQLLPEDSEARKRGFDSGVR